MAKGEIRLTLDKASPGEVLINTMPRKCGPTHKSDGSSPEAAAPSGIERSVNDLEHLTLQSHPKLISCGLGFDPQIKSYGPLATWNSSTRTSPTLIVPNDIGDPSSGHRNWFGAIRENDLWPKSELIPKTAGTTQAYWTTFIDRGTLSPIRDINELYRANRLSEWVQTMTPNRLVRMEQERAAYELYTEAFEGIPHRPAGSPTNPSTPTSAAAARSSLRKS